MSIFHNNGLIGASGQGGGTGGYSISRSLRFNSSDSAYLSRTPASQGNRKTWTWAGWVKRSAFPTTLNAHSVLMYVNNPNDCALRFEYSTEQLRFFLNGASAADIKTTAVFRDPSAWYHIVLALDTSQATTANRVKLYVNGVETTAFATASYPSQNYESAINTAVEHNIGRSPANIEYFNGYLADIYFIDGQALTPSSFTETDATTGQLIPKAYTGSYGTNGFHLEFADNSSNTATTLGKDTSGNSPANNWTPNNLSVTAGAGNDSLVDVPTNGAQTDTGVGGEVRGNYCTLNPLGGKSTVTLANGNLERTGGANNKMGTIGMSSGKWYWEIVCTNLTGSAFNGVTQYSHEPDDYALSYMYNASGTKYVAAVETSYGASYAVNDVIGFAYDADNGSLVCYKNGVSQGTLVSGLSGKTLFPLTRSDGNAVMVCNFGQRPFAYTAPSGFKALCTANLPAPLVTKPSTVFDVALDTGANILSAAQNKLSTGTDLLWIKDRANANNHQLIDTVRGGTATLQSNTTSAETTYSAPTGSSVAWCWDAGSSTVTNTQGSITSSVRANATAGFSIVTFTGNGVGGATIGHGLGVAPSMIIQKMRSGSNDWDTYHVALGNTKGLSLNSTSAATTSSSGYWNNTSPTSTVYTVGTGPNQNGSTYVAYCFAPVVGYSSFGSYNANGSTDGPMIWLGFKPKVVLIKAYTSHPYGSWRIYDSARGAYNVIAPELYPNSASSEYGGGVYMDFLSNGFKIRENSFINDSGQSFIYCAWAESPFNYARAR